MKRSPRARLFCLALAIALPAQLYAQTADPTLVSEINRIRAVDNPAPIPKVVGGGKKPDDKFDALPSPPEADAWRFPRPLPTTPNTSPRGAPSTATITTT